MAAPRAVEEAQPRGKPIGVLGAIGIPANEVFPLGLNPSQKKRSEPLQKYFKLMQGTNDLSYLEILGSRAPDQKAWSRH